MLSRAGSRRTLERVLRRTSLLRVPVLALAAALLAACGAQSTGGGGAATPAVGKAPAFHSGTQLSHALPSSLLDMPLTDSDGSTVHLSDFAGKTVVIQDTMTLCQELCPIDTATLVQTAREWTQQHPGADADNTVFLTITVDPQRDDPTQLAAYRKLYVGGSSDLPQWELLTGSPSHISALWKYLGVYVKRVKQDDVVHNWRTGKLLTYDVAHSDEVFFLDGKGRERYILDGMPSLAGDKAIPAKIEAFMSAEGHDNEKKMSGWTTKQGLSVLGWMNGLSS
jgi:protein SCO1